jgi:uncharacterized RDD family membrane protein YckC
MPAADRIAAATSMNRKLHQLLLLAALSCAAAFGARAAQQDPQTPAAQQQVEQQTTPEEPAATPDVEAQTPAQEAPLVRVRNEHGQNEIVHIGHDSHLRANEAADAVVSIFGSSTSEGSVDEVVISVFGSSRATGPVGDSVISVFGDTYVNSTVQHDVVAAFGNLELGPEAVIGGDAVAVGGTITRAPGAVVKGDMNEVAFGQGLGRLDWLRPWFEHCLMYGRPLAFAPGLGWAWAAAGVFFALYMLLALMFSRTVEQCVETLETQPGQTLLAAVLTVLLTPPLFLLITITVIGIAIVPLLALALFCAALFGKAVILAAIGRRITRLTGVATLNHIAAATIVGGLLVLAIYTVPVLGFIAQNVIGIAGLGAVVYTCILALRARKAVASEAEPAVAGAGISGAAVSAAEAHAAMGASTGASASAMNANEHAAAAQAAAPEVTTPLATTAQRAGFWIRMAALLIDIVLIAIVVNFLNPLHEVWILALAAYGAVMWKLKATTIGGLVCGLKIVRLDGRSLTWDTTIVRALSCFLSLACAGLGFFWIAFDKERQAWHDKIAGTIVVRVPSGSLV